MRSTVKLCSVLVSALVCYGCAYGYVFSDDQPFDLDISGTTFENAYSKVLFTLSELDYTVDGDSGAGTIEAKWMPGSGATTFTHITTISGLLTNMGDDKHRLRIRIKASKNEEEIANDFADRLGKHFNVVLSRPQQ